VLPHASCVFDIAGFGEISRPSAIQHFQFVFLTSSLYKYCIVQRSLVLSFVCRSTERPQGRHEGD